jgi:hypothetical protein
MHPTDHSATRPLTPDEQIGGLQRSLFNALAEAARLSAALTRLIDGVRRWAADLDGVPDYLFADYEAARAALGSK